MAEPTLRDMYRWSGGSNSPPTTLPGDASQSTAPASASDRGLQISAAPEPNDDSESFSDQAFSYPFGSKYPTPYQQGGKNQQYYNNPQAPTNSRASSTRKRGNHENQPSELPQTPGARQRLSGGSQLPSMSLPPGDRPRYSDAPQSTTVSRSYEEGQRYSNAPESKILAQTSGQARRPSADKSQSVSAVQNPAPHLAIGSIRRSDRNGNGSHALASQPTTSSTSRPYEDRHRLDVRTSDDKQRFSAASTIAQPASSRQSEDKQRFSSGVSAITPGGAADTLPIAVPTNTSAPAPGPTASTRDQVNTSNFPKKLTASKSVAIDVKAISSDDSKSSEQTKRGLDTPVDLATFRALLGKPSGNEPLPLSNIRRVAEAIDEGRTPTSIKTPSRTNTGKSSIAISLKVKSRGPSFLPRFLRRRPDDSEYDTSVYYSLMREETKVTRLYALYDGLTYVCLIVQLIISAVLIILGAVNGDYHIPVAILGAVTGLITGILSLIRGQGLPQRLMRYADGLRRVREDIEFTERELIAHVRPVTYGECLQLRTEYDNVREDAVKNHPDTWTSTSGTDSSRTSKRSKWPDLEGGEK